MTSPIIFDNLKNAVIGGLYDPAFGPMDSREKCRTCGLNSYECPGHFGHVEVSVPLYNPLVFMTLFKVLRTSCMHCFKFRMTEYEMGQFCERFELLKGGELVEAMVCCAVFLDMFVRVYVLRQSFVTGGGRWVDVIGRD